MKTQWIVGLVVGALVLGFAGGIVGTWVLPAPTLGGDVTGLTARVDRVETGQQDLEARVAVGGAGLKVGVVDPEALFTRVFLPQVRAERAAMDAKNREILALQADHTAGRIRLDAFQQRAARLQAELIQASLRVNMAMLDRMIASPGFLDLRAQLETLRTQAGPLGAGVEAVVREAQVVILDLAGFSGRLQQLHLTFQELDRLLTQAASVMILQFAQQVAREQRFDVVLRTRDVVMYRREATVLDLSGDVETRLWALFPGTR